MKKITSAFILATAATLSGTALAAVDELVSGKTIDATACTILRDRVTVNLSTNVKSAYNCDDVKNVITVASCHTSGSQKPTTLNCVNSGDTANPKWNDPSCTQTSDTFTINGRRVFSGNSAGGSVVAGDLKSATCDVNALKAIDAMK